MGKNHATTGLILGCLIAATLRDAPLLLRLEVIPVCGGAALLPDIDTRQSRVARSLGPVTQLVAAGVSWLSIVVYEATRTELDSKSHNGGHRRLSHSVPGCAGFGVITGVAVLAHPVAGTVVLALLIGLMALGVKQLGAGFAAVGVVGSWLTVTHYSSWWWLWPTVVTLGSLVHCLGDAATNSGVPLLWPLLRNGKRWDKVRFPATFETGKVFETEVVTRLLAVALVAAAGFTVGLPQLVIHAYAS